MAWKPASVPPVLDVMGGLRVVDDVTGVTGNAKSDGQVWLDSGGLGPHLGSEPNLFIRRFYPDYEVGKRYNPATGRWWWPAAETPPSADNPIYNPAPGAVGAAPAQPKINVPNPWTIHAGVWRSLMPSTQKRTLGAAEDAGWNPEDYMRQMQNAAPQGEPVGPTNYYRSPRRSFWGA